MTSVKFLSIIVPISTYMNTPNHQRAATTIPTCEATLLLPIGETVGFGIRPQTV